MENNKTAAKAEMEKLLTEYNGIRIEQSISQEMLTKKCGVQQNLISKIETRKNAPRLVTLIRLLLPLGKTLTITPFSDENKKKEL